MTRPPPKDQPPPEETAELVAALEATVRVRERIAAASEVRGPDSRRVYVLPGADGRAWLALVEHGAVIAERTVAATWLLERLGGGAGFDDLAALLED